jgi:hypothetical protein
MPWEMIALFSVGDQFSTEPGPGFFVPALRGEFYPAGKCDYVLILSLSLNGEKDLK